MFGTASNVVYWLLLEYTQPWTEKVIKNNNLPSNINQYLIELLNYIPNSRILFIKKHNQQPNPIHLFIVTCQNQSSYVTSFHINSYNELISLDLINKISKPDRQNYNNRPEKLFLVCTDGKHDRCCAKYGYTIYNKLNYLVGEQAWQCTHVGGDRFAANLVCFPHAIYYGHVEAPELEEIVHLHKSNAIYLQKFRGRACFNRYAQIGEYFTRKMSGLINICELIFFDQKQIGENTWQIKFMSLDKSKIYSTVFICLESNFSQYLTCHAKTEKKVEQCRLIKYEVLPNQ